MTSRNVTITQLLAKRSVGIMASMSLLQFVRSVLKLETSSSETDFQESLKGLSVAKLKVLCKEFEVRSSGNKAELIGQLISLWKRENALGDDTEPCQGSLTDFNVGEVTNWTKDLSVLDDFTFMHMYDYLINSREREYDHESLKAFKSLKAYKYFADGLVKNVSLSKYGNNNLVIRCHCFSSLKAKTTYQVYLLVEKSGNVLAAKCKCVAGKGAACSHCAALMFHIEDLKRKGEKCIPIDNTVTDKLQQWHIPPKRTVQPQLIKDINFVKSEYGKVKLGPSEKKQNFDPRHTDDRTLSLMDVDTLISSVTASCPTSGIRHFWPSASDDSATNTSTVTPTNDVSVSSFLYPLIVYQASQPLSLPDTVLELADVDPDCTVFKELCHLFESQQVISEELSKQIEQLTVMQSESSLWCDIHNGRITSSRFGQIVHRRETTDTTSIIKQVMGYNSAKYSNLPQLQWGIQKESTAIQCYIDFMEDQVIVIPTGLTLMPSHSYLGASSDGLIVHNGRPNSPGVLEVKCPYSIQGNSVCNMPPLDIAANYSAFHIADDNHLRKEHNYYYQVQGEMAVKGCKWAHFVTWTEASKNNLHVEEIQFDEELWKAYIFPKLQQFYIDVLVPEILLRKVQSNIMH